ncbi:GNAT family N-acetyltransferase [Roseateles saccharophilus]|uniref:Acetyltransferase (GNAT) family protein n=1 Tax=Roseateles saccharophilus TaxID=304 RepID=A0A4R3VJ44_ROSSA|nr:GNAT family N-acetyltransferase [Roseateles saccharophilus]TCV03912.1 acetyltransferase (GNAT) family protein [Roseateles saccharophilus]
MIPTLAPVAGADFEEMLALRIEALRPSLERLGRFSPDVARVRLRSQFRPEWMKHLVVEGERVGYFTVEPREDELRLHHLYLKPAAQGRGIGAWVIDRIKSQGRPITLAALRESRANDFYRRHGFRVVAEQEFDIEYRWEALA